MKLVEHRSLVRTETYGPFPDQVGDLFLPHVTKPPLLCLLHGGFWRMPYGRDQMVPVAENLVQRGFAVWNLEYRRLGVPAGGRPCTCEDVAAGIEYLANLRAAGVDIDLDRVAVIGHSAGGHLALWAAAQQRRNQSSGAIPRVRIKAVVGEAPLGDLKRASEIRVGRNAVVEFLGATYSEHPKLYESASPIALLPFDIPQLIVHGTADDVVPIEISRRYANAAADAGDQVDLIELPGMGHMEFINPLSCAHKTVVEWLMRVLG